ncbi:MAG: TIGR02710 family CRISPR-associated CARF protein [Gemmataceae bacterium]|nr:TIGR02710 family CRISPR-associated CARF protein [Gemmataceae bacterium]
MLRTSSQPAPSNDVNNGILQDHIEKWQRILRGQESYDGNGSAVEQARRYYFENINDIVVTLTRQRSFVNQQLPEVYLLISLMGHSPETTITVFEVLRPQRLLILTNRETEGELQWIDNYLIRTGKLPLPRYERRDYHPNDVISIFRIIEDRLGMDDVKNILSQQSSEPTFNGTARRVVIDITGGKKAMGAMAALAAWEYGVEPCYLDGEYDAHLRRPRPGTERLLMLGQSMKQLGGRELEAAKRLFEAGAYETAREQFLLLADRLANPEEARLFRDLSRLYAAWCTLDIDHLHEYADTLKNLLEQTRLPVRHAAFQALHQQFEFLEQLSKRDPDALVLNHYLLGLHYQDIHRYDFAALLFYRTIEGCFIRRLHTRNPDFHPQRPRYELLGDRDELSRKYLNIAKQLDPNFNLQDLPHRISLMDAAVLLCALDDDLIHHTGLHTPEALGNLRQLTEIRNRSILAHGYNSVTKEGSAELEGRAWHILEKYWQITHPEQQLREYCKQLRFLRNFDL